MDLCLAVGQPDGQHPGEKSGIIFILNVHFQKLKLTKFNLGRELLGKLSQD